MIKFIVLISLFASVSSAKDTKDNKLNRLKLFYSKLLLEKEPSACKKIGKILKTQNFHQADLDKISKIGKSKIPNVKIFSKEEMESFIFLFKNWNRNDYNFLKEAFNNPAAYVIDEESGKPSSKQKEWAKNNCKRLSLLVYDLKTFTVIQSKSEELANMTILENEFSLNQIVGECHERVKKLINQLKFEDLCPSL